MSRRRAFALIELLVVIVIILILVGGYFGLRGKGQGKSVPAKAIEKAESVECRTYLSQVRQNVQMETSTGEAPPQTLDQEPTKSISRCPVSGMPYNYNPQSGQVNCTTPGHERY